MASRFFAGGVSDSDYSSSEEELLSSSSDEEFNSSSSDEDEGNSNKPALNAKFLKKSAGGVSDSDDSEFGNDDDDDSDSDSDYDGKPRGPSYFLKKSFAKDDSDSDSDEDDKKVVKSAKEKLLEEMQDTVSSMENSAVVSDWITALNEFDKLNRLVSKSQKQNLSTPNFYVKSLAELEDTVGKFSAEDTKKLNASESKAFNAIKQRVKKAVRESAELIAAFRENPDAFEREHAAAGAAGSDNAGSSAAGAAAASTSAAASPQETVFTTLRFVTESRGKKNVDTREQIKTLESLIEIATSPYQLIVIYLMLIPLRFDNMLNLSFMPLDQWKNALNDINKFLAVLESNRDSYRVLETAKPLDDIETEPEKNAEGVKEILGSVVSFVERLDDEFTRSLQIIDPHSTEYIDRLKDEQLIYDLIIRAQLYSADAAPVASGSGSGSDSVPAQVSAEEESQVASTSPTARIVSRRIDHIYYKPEALIKINETTAAAHLANYQTLDNVDQLLESLFSVLIATGTNSTLRKKAILSNIYYNSLNNNYAKAKELFLQSHLLSSVNSSDPQLQILFNRALVQLGLSAFRNGLIQDSHQILT